MSPHQAFSQAARVGLLAELDQSCQAEQLRGAVDAKLNGSLALFLNGEPSSFATPPSAALLDAVAQAAGRFRVVMEITERRLLHNPAELFRAIRRIRDRGWGIALDDVGAVPESLAMLPFIAPDVIKLDLSLVQRWPTTTQGGIVTAVMAYAERTGAAVLAEGIETPAHLDQALALGATLGQGWFYSAAGPLLETRPVDRPIPFLPAPPPTAPTPFDLVKGGPLRVASKGVLLGISRHLENQGLSMAVPPVVLSTFQSAANFTPATARRYAELAVRCPLVAALGYGLASEPIPGVFGANLGPGDALRGEWTVVVVGPHYAAALIARDLGDSGPDLDRRFAFTVTHRPEVVVAAALSMFERLEIRASACREAIPDGLIIPGLLAPAVA